MRGISFTILLCLICSQFVLGQGEAYERNQFLIQLQAHHKVEPLLEKLKKYDSTLEWEAPVRLIPRMEIWQLEYRGNSDQAALLEFLRANAAVQMAQYNHKVSLRSPEPLNAPTSTTPNDPNYSNQWQYSQSSNIDLDADLAWDITTGGVTATNDTIVVAVLDNGISPSHNDFGDNLWVNRAEIPGNNLDDDGNGYEDDYLGWNSTTQTDLIAGGGHGTSVAGIVGAKGNNNMGVTGVNWNVKLMIINNSWNVNEAKVLEAYGYALTQRRIYNESNGAQGAYVVATNASWGMNNGQPANAPLWCAFYDTLGSYGILNVAATANSNSDVDVVGDLPTACPSDYLVAVTNVNKLGYKELQAAYGSTSIDLGAFGSAVHTTISPTGYGNFGGTSGASPHVAGAVALLYAGACHNFMVYSTVHPDSAALKMKAFIMNGVVPAVDLTGTTVSGGYLNLFNSMNECLGACPSHTCFSVYQLSGSNIIDTSAQINWTYPSTVNQLKYRYKEQGGSWNSFSTIPQGQSSIQINNLLACTHYEVQLVSVCGAMSGDTTFYTFKTDGCCEAPSGVRTLSVNNDSIHLSWDPLLAANSYIIQYKEAGFPNWQTINGITNNEVWLTNLLPCSYYDISVQAICNTGDTTVLSDTISVITLGCMSCGTIAYCTAKGANAVDDWIDTFRVDNYVFPSGNDSGYVFFDSVVITLGKGDYHNIAISQGKSFTEFVKIWLDINQDGDFDDPNEELYSDIMNTVDTTIKGSIIVPPSTLLGVTRLRVAMRWNNSPSTCGSIDYGEVEDYCVLIVQGNSVSTLPKDIASLKVYPNPFSDQIRLDLNLVQQTDLNVLLYAATGQMVYSKAFQQLPRGDQQLVLSPDIPSGVYFLQLISDAGQLSQRVLKVH